MAKKSPATGVDFILRTMMEREASGKRKIRPKNVEDVLLPEDSDDSDYDYVGDSGDLDDDDDSGDDNSNKSDSEDSDGSSEDSDSDDDSSERSGSDDSDENVEGGSKSKSALRDTLKKLKDEAQSFPKPKKKKKKPSASKSKVNSTNDLSTGTKNSGVSVSGSGAESSKSKPVSGDATDSLQNGPATAAASTKKKNVSKKSKPKNKSKSNGKDKDDVGGSKRKHKKKSSSSKKKDKKLKYNSISSLVDNLESLQSEGRKEINLDHRICWFCLGDKSDETNEIIECDSCGITVHEVCYGVGDNVSVSSGTESSNSTEPWFCDACKSGVRNISCEVCPAKGGLFKETTTGRWVHLICAMYIPGIQVADDGTVNLLDVSYSNWGYYLCSSCENDRDARIGITIRCDAGLCKTYIHATCAHKAGLLSDPNVAVDLTGQVADPYYAACKMHTNREVARRRAESYKILREQIRIRQERKNSETMTDAEKQEQSRIQNKIEKIRSKMAAKFLHNNVVDPTSLLKFQPPENINVVSLPSQIHSLPISWREGSKKSRMLHTTPFVDRFLLKAAIIGHDIKALELEDKHERIAANVKRKWNIQPSLSVEYAAYYADRELRLTTLGDQCEKLEKDKMQLIDKHAGLKSAYEALSSSHKADVEDGEKIAKNIESLREVLTFLSPANQNLNSIVVPKRRHSSTPGRNKSPPSKRDRRSPSSKRSSKSSKPTKNSPLNGSQSPTGRLRIVKCAVCNNSDDQHLITRCDECRKNYHLRCLDPPLSRMPKKSKSFGWMCSDCGDESEESDSPQVDTEAPRTLRGRENLKKPNKYRSAVSPIANNHNVSTSPKTPKSQPNSTPTPTPGSTGSSGSAKDNKDNPSSKLDKESPSVWGVPKITSPSNNLSSECPLSSFNEGKCHTCNRDDFKKNLVMCDKCYLEFHFLCLQPPLKYSPKRRGYSWFCANCDEASSVDSHHSLKDQIEPLPESGI